MWSNGRLEVFSEGQLRSRLMTSIRDLKKSSLYRKGRAEQLPTYIVFQRAVAYYRALCTIWGRENLTNSELRIKNAEILDMIRNSISIE